MLILQTSFSSSQDGSHQPHHWFSLKQHYVGLIRKNNLLTSTQLWEAKSWVHDGHRDMGE